MIKARYPVWSKQSAKNRETCGPSLLVTSEDTTYANLVGTSLLRRFSIRFLLISCLMLYWLLVLHLPNSAGKIFPTSAKGKRVHFIIMYTWRNLEDESYFKYLYITRIYLQGTIYKIWTTEVTHSQSKHTLTNLNLHYNPSFCHWSLVLLYSARSLSW